MDETKQRTADTRGLRGAEAAAVLRFGLGEAAEPHSEGFGERSISRTPLSTTDTEASEWRSARAAAAGGITLAVLVAAGVGFPQSGTESPYANVAHGSVSGPAVSAAGGSAGHRVGVIHKESEQMSILRNSVQASVVAGAALVAASAGAQSAAVQWKVSEGGNGHWYRVIVSGSITWDEARTESERLGGHLATVTNAEEDTFAASVASVPSAWNFDQGFGPWLGGYQSVTAQDFAEPAGGWRWVTSESWSWAAWNAAGYDEPNECTSCCGSAENFLHYKNRSANVIDRIWNDLASQGVQPCGQPVAFVIEWDGDCNNDNIVDYGQILLGQLADTNNNGIPDICEVPTCADADLNPNGAVDGADLGALLAFWGPVSPAFPRADINGDGNVNGADLGVLLSVWGPCGG